MNAINVPHTDENSSSSSSHEASNLSRRIQVLPPDVVDKIAAGEVIQRPASVVKELLENSLDAGATDIHVTMDGYNTITISDNGSGITQDDLPLAAVRHATSKLRQAHDLQQLATFGFRGEALASVCLVSRSLTITSRTANSAVGYVQTYRDGNNQAKTAPQPKARPRGTTITVSDLFFNLPHRRRSKGNDEYQRVLQIVQHYAILVAGQGTSLTCQKVQGKKTLTDLNTSGAVREVVVHDGKTSVVANDDAAVQATKQVVAQVFGSQLLSFLHPFSCGCPPTSTAGAGNNAALSTSVTATDKDDDAMTYTCRGVLLSPSCSTLRRSALVLFINHRLVECRELQRSMEDAYGGFTKNKPLVFLSLHVPPHEVDVNVHPTKRQVALLYQEALIRHLTQCVHDALTQLPHEQAQAGSIKTAASRLIQNPYLKRALPSFGTGSDDVSDKSEAVLDFSGDVAVAGPERGSDDEDDDNMDGDDDNEARSASQPTLSQQRLTAIRPTASKLPPAKKIRTSRLSQAGSLEPFVMSQKSTQMESSSNPSTRLENLGAGRLSFDPSDEASEDREKDNSTSRVPAATVHLPDCPLHAPVPDDTDMSIPGAFAVVAARCRCNALSSQAAAIDVLLPRQAVHRPKKVMPTDCSYASIISLRKKISKRVDADLQKKLRNSVFVGVISRHRCLIQCGEELVLLHHTAAAQEMFYQMALSRFAGGADMAVLGGSGDDNDEHPGGLHIETLVAQALQLEEDLRTGSRESVDYFSQERRVSDTNTMLAAQVASCLLEHADMLLEYFAIAFGKDEHDKVMLHGLPILLDGHTPPPHGLAVFLLRLATEVNWTDEKPCFRDICRELGAYYAQPPRLVTSPKAEADADNAVQAADGQLYSYVRHTVYPALSSLWIPSQRAAKHDDPAIGVVVTMAKLSQLYRVFERC